MEGDVPSNKMGVGGVRLSPIWHILLQEIQDLFQQKKRADRELVTAPESAAANTYTGRIRRSVHKCSCLPDRDRIHCQSWNWRFPMTAAGRQFLFSIVPGPDRGGLFVYVSWFCPFLSLKWRFFEAMAVDVYAAFCRQFLVLLVKV